MEYKPLEALPKYFKYAYTFIFGVLIFVSVVNALFGNYAYVLFPSVVLLSNLIIVLAKVRLTVYERGIRFGLTFVGWCDVKGIEWRNGILSIRTKSRTIRIVDKIERFRKLLGVWFNNVLQNHKTYFNPPNLSLL